MLCEKIKKIYYIFSNIDKTLLFFLYINEPVINMKKLLTLSIACSLSSVQLIAQAPPAAPSTSENTTPPPVGSPVPTPVPSPVTVATQPNPTDTSSSTPVTTPVPTPTPTPSSPGGTDDAVFNYHMQHIIAYALKEEIV